MNSVFANIPVPAALLTSLLALSACASKKVDIPIVRGPTLGVTVDEITVQRFATGRSHVTHAATLADMVIAGIGRNQFVTVKTHAQYQLAGQLDVSKWAYEQAIKDNYKITKKLQYRKDGKKCEVTKKGALTGTYNLLHNNGTAAGGGSFNIPIVDKGSDKSCSGARAELKSESELLQNAMEVAAQKIVAAVSPTRVKMKIVLMEGGSSDNELGIDFFMDGLPDQAMNIWTQVVENNSSKQARTAAYHNIGVAYEAQGDLKTAFDHYAEASSLNPKEKKHRVALKRLQDRQSGLEITKKYR